MARFRLLLRFALVVCVIVSTQGLLVIQGAFHLNRDAIAAVYCVNKDMPEMDCNGACELSRRMQEEHGHSSSEGTAVLDIALSVAATLAASGALAPPPHADATLGVRPVLGFARGDETGVFRPPRA